MAVYPVPVRGPRADHQRPTVPHPAWRYEWFMENWVWLVSKEWKTRGMRII